MIQPVNLRQRDVQPALGVELAAKLVLAAVTLLLCVSMGGQLGLPVLLPAHLWAARRSGPVGRILWSLPAGVAGAIFVWLAIYTTAGEPTTVIWLAPLGAAVLATYLMWRAARRPSRLAAVLAPADRVSPSEGGVIAAVLLGLAASVAAWVAVVAFVAQQNRTNADWALIPVTGLAVFATLLWRVAKHR